MVIEAQQLLYGLGGLLAFVAGAYLITGRKNKPSGFPTIYLDNGQEGYRGQVEQFYRDAEKLLRMPFRKPEQSSFYWRFTEGWEIAKDGRKGKTVDHFGKKLVMTAGTDNLGNTVVYLTDGELRYDGKSGGAHEAAHHILYSNGIAWDKHHSIMRKAGFEW